LRIERVKRWPAQRQEDVARVIERMEEIGTDAYRLSDEERSLIDEGLASPLVREEKMETFWNRRGV
jgi:hypothetical protein